MQAPTQEVSKAPPTSEAEAPITDVPDQGAQNPAWSHIARSMAATNTVGDELDGGVVEDAGVEDAGVADAGSEIRDAALPAGTPSPEPTDPNQCSTDEEETRKNNFRMNHFSVTDHIPSTGLGKFDAHYWPMASTMLAYSKLHLNFIQADATPDPITLAQMLWSGQAINQFFWSASEKASFKQQFLQRTSQRWSGQHQMQSQKPCWNFTVNPILYPMYVSDPSDAHFTVTVHKSAGPIEYKSGISHPGVSSAQGQGNLWESDNRENADFNSLSVAQNERQRIERAISSTSSSPVLFDNDSTVVKPVHKASLKSLAGLLKQKNPSDPAIPLNLEGSASSEGRSRRNTNLSRDRADAVRDFLNAEGVSQPLITSHLGPQGSPNDATQRKVEVSADTSFESTYNSNRYSVGEHEFGHLFGMPDEYQNNTGSSFLGTAQTNYNNLVSAAGVQGPSRWGDSTSSQMSAGVDVLPRHYVTLWEALGQMTSPDLTRSDWRIV